MANADGFPPAVWGPHFWLVIHLTAATFPSSPTPAQREQYAAFFKSLKNVLPCPGCRAGYATLTGSGPLKLRPAVFRDRQSLFTWTVDLHNAVNAKLGKPQHVDAARWYSHYARLKS